jgi:hypothetical protein
MRDESLVISVCAADTTRSRHRDLVTGEVGLSEQKSYTRQASSEAWRSIAAVMKQESVAVENSLEKKSTMTLVRAHNCEGDGSLIISSVSTGH